MPPARPAFGCGYIVFPVVFVFFGLMCFAAGAYLAPGTNEAARAFRTDPSCSADLRTNVPPGNCAIVDATVVYAVMRETRPGTSRTLVHTPYASVRTADGRTYDAELDGGAWNRFVDDARSGAPARAQTFRGTLVRITSGNSSTETTDAPDVNQKTTNEMPWVGAVSIAIAVLIVVLRAVALRRTA